MQNSKEQGRRMDRDCHFYLFPWPFRFRFSLMSVMNQEGGRDTRSISAPFLYPSDGNTLFVTIMHDNFVFCLHFRRTPRGNPVVSSFVSQNHPISFQPSSPPFWRILRRYLPPSATSVSMATTQMFSFLKTLFSSSLQWKMFLFLFRHHHQMHQRVKGATWRVKELCLA